MTILIKIRNAHVMVITSGELPKLLPEWLWNVTKKPSIGKLWMVFGCFWYIIFGEKKIVFEPIAVDTFAVFLLLLEHLPLQSVEGGFILSQQRTCDNLEVFSED